MLKRETRFMTQRRGVRRDDHGDPTEAMSNLFDIAVLIGVGFLIVSLSGFGLKDLLSKEDVTVAVNPGKIDMELITRENGRIKRMKASGEMAEGAGMRIGSVYRLQSGQVVWMPENDGSLLTSPTP